MKIGKKQFDTFVRLAKTGGLHQAIEHTKVFVAEQRSVKISTALQKDFRKSYKSQRALREQEMSADKEIAKQDFASIENSYQTDRLPTIKAWPKVSIIVLNRNGRAHLERLLSAIHTNTQYTSYEIIIIDNASTDGSIDYVQSNCYDLPLKIIKNNQNTSFSHGCNQGARAADGELLLFLNNDIQPLRGWLTRLVATYEKNKKSVGSIGARLIYPEKEKFDNSYAIQHAGIKFEYDPFSHFFRPYNFGKGESLHEHKKQRDFPALTAALLLVPAKIFDEIGGFDEGYNYGYEDVDLGLKIFKRGYRNIYDPEVTALHYEFGTQSLDEKAYVRQRRQSNMELFKQKWHTYITKEALKDNLQGSKFLSEQEIVLVLDITDKTNDISQRLPKNWTRQELDKKKSLLTPNFCIILTDNIDFSYQASNEFSPAVLTVYCGTQDIPAKKFYKHQRFDFVVLGRKVSEQRKSYVTDYCYALPASNEEGFTSSIVAQIEKPTLSIKIPTPMWSEASRWGDYHFALALKKYLLREGIYVKIQVKKEFYKEEYNFHESTLLIRGLTTHKPLTWQKKFIWIISHPDKLAQQECEDYDVVLVASQKVGISLQKSISRKVIYFPQCTDSEFFVPTTNKDVEREVSGKTIFIGETRDVFREAVKLCIEAKIPLRVYGPGWSKYIPKEMICGQYIENTQLPAYYNHADIVLNDHWADMKSSGIVSNRVFDVLASGGKIVTDDVQDFPEDIKPYVTIYRDGSDFAQSIEKAKHLTRTEKEVQKIRSVIKESYSFESRAKKIRNLMCDDRPLRS